MEQTGERESPLGERDQASWKKGRLELGWGVRECFRENEKGREAGGTEIVRTEIGGDRRERVWAPMCTDQMDMGDIAYLEEVLLCVMQ